MANLGSINALKDDSIDTSVTTNGAGQNTGARVNVCLNDIVDTLTGSPVVSTGVSNPSSVFASAAQGLLAETAIQPNEILPVATDGVLTGNTIWVDAVNGDDDTAVVGRQDLPFLTLTAAKDAADAGNLIHVRPATYSVDDNLAADQVNWHLENGVTIRIEATSDVDLFGDGGRAMSFNITGSGILETNPTDSFISHLISVTNAKSSVNVQCLDIVNIGRIASGFSSNPINHEGGGLSVACRDIRVTGSGAGYPVWWKDGALNVRARTIGQYSDGSGGAAVSLTTIDQPNGEAYIQADLIESQNAGSAAIQQGVNFDTPTDNSTARAWVNALQVIGDTSPSNSEAIYKSDGGNLYVTAQKITGAWTSSGDYGELYVDVQKVQTYDTDDPTPIINLSGFKSFVNIGNLTDGDNGDTLLTVGEGTQVLHISQLKRDNNKSAIRVSGGTLILNSSRIDTSIDDKAFPIVKSGGDLVLNSCVLISEGLQNSIYAPEKQTVVSYGSYANNAVDSNVTVDGLLTVGAYVA